MHPASERELRTVLGPRFESAWEHPRCPLREEGPWPCVHVGCPDNLVGEINDHGTVYLYSQIPAHERPATCLIAGLALDYRFPGRHVGLGSEIDQSHRLIGACLGVTRQRVQQIEVIACERARATLRREGTP